MEKIEAVGKSDDRVDVAIGRVEGLLSRTVSLVMPFWRRILQVAKPIPEEPPVWTEIRLVWRWRVGEIMGE